MPLSALTGTRLRERRLAGGPAAGRCGGGGGDFGLLPQPDRAQPPQGHARGGGPAGRGPGAGPGGAGRGAVRRPCWRGCGRRRGGRTAVPAELDRLEEFVGRFPGWAGLVADLDGRVQGLERAIEALNDRMTHDPHLSQALHEVLSSLSSVRATAAILAETPDLSPDWADRFHRNLHGDSERLASGAEALVAYLDAGSTMAEQGIAAPQEEVEDWLTRRGWAISDAELAGRSWRLRWRGWPRPPRAAWRGPMWRRRRRMRRRCRSRS